METEEKLDLHLLQALATDGEGESLFDVVIGFEKNEDEAAMISAVRNSRLARLGPRTAKGALTREQLLKIAEQPAVKYLRLVERLVAAS
jgi:hypothetical protein